MEIQCAEREENKPKQNTATMHDNFGDLNTYSRSIEMRSWKASFSMVWISLSVNCLQAKSNEKEMNAHVIILSKSSDTLLCVCVWQYMHVQAKMEGVSEWMNTASGCSTLFTENRADFSRDSYSNCGNFLSIKLHTNFFCECARHAHIRCINTASIITATRVTYISIRFMHAAGQIMSPILSF